MLKRTSQNNITIVSDIELQHIILKNMSFRENVSQLK